MTFHVVRKNILDFFIYSLIFLGFSVQAQADWAANFGGITGSTTQVYASTVDSAGNLYVTGTFSDSILTLGSVTLNRLGAQDSFAVKINTSGTVVWAKKFGGAGATNVTSTAITVDSSGNVYLAGSFNVGDLTSPALTKIGTSDAVAIKLDSSGNTTWARNYGGVGALANGSAIRVDGSGNVYLGGSLSSANLTTPAVTKIGTSDALIIKIDSAGTTGWSKNYGGSGSSMTVKGIAFDGSGNVFLGGYFQSANLTTPALARIGISDAFLFKLDANGATVWAQNYGGSGVNAYGYALTDDGSGNIFLGGGFQSGNLTTPAVAKIGSFDTFVIKLASSGTTTWVKNYGGSGAVATSNAITVDSSGNVYLSGYFAAASLTTPALTRVGVQDAFAIKLDLNGNTTWSKSFSGSGVTFGNVGVGVDASGNVYLGSHFKDGNLSTPSLTKLGIQDVVMIKLDSNGGTTLSKNFGGLVNGGAAVVAGIARDDSGNVYLAGNFTNQTVTFGSVTLTRSGTTDAFVVKTDRVGTVLWAKNYGGTDAATFATAIAVGTSGQIYVAAYFNTASLTTPVVTKVGNGDALVMQLDSSGSITWFKTYSGAGATAVTSGIATDAGGNVYVGGSFNTANLTTPAFTKLGTRDSFILKLDSVGSTTWAKSYGGAGAFANSNAVAVDTNGNVYWSGYMQSANLTTPAVTKIGTIDAIAMKITSAGATTWAKNFGGTGASAYARGIAVDAAGNVYLAGYVSGANLTTPALTRIGTQDVYALKLNSSGTSTWITNGGGTGAKAFGNAIAVDVTGNVYLAGTTNVNLTTPNVTKIGATDSLALKMDATGAIIWFKNYGGSAAASDLSSIAVDGTGNIYLGGSFNGASLTTPALTIIGATDALFINAKLFNVACSTAGKIKYDAANNVLVFCDGSFYQSMSTAASAACTGTSAGKLQYYNNGASSDFVWYAGACRSSRSTVTYGACTGNGRIQWDSSHGVISGCINGTWTALKGW